MSETQHNTLAREISTVIEDIQKIQTRITSTGEPASQLELHELQRLGRQYSSLVEQLMKARFGQ